MLFVFFVDTGTMLHLDMNLALDTVENLMQNIASQFRIPEDKQVLLISGGESLNPKARVCSYSAGTDTNPIYLFSKSTLEGDENPPIPTTEVGTDADLSEQVEASLNMPPTYTTVVTRAQLAQELYDQANRIIKDCEKLVHQQHLQQQGWAAVVANLEDTTHALKVRMTKFEEMYNSYLNTHSESCQLLKNFQEDLLILAKIPVLPALVSRNSESGDFSQDENNSLLHWISSKGDQSSLEQVVEICMRGLHQFNADTFKTVRTEVNNLLEQADNNVMKEIKGLEERLCGLEQLMYESKLKVQEQKDQAAAFQQNQERAGNIGDPSILPDLCTSHRRQLQVMQKTHQHLRDIRRRCIRAKEELSSNLNIRLRWITHMERSMVETCSKLFIYYENLRRLRTHLEIVKQIHLAPKMYLAAVAEVVRRKAFSKAYLQWSTSLSQQSLEMHTREVSNRKAFYSQLSTHFLLALFRGMDEYPSPFATQAPLPFDLNLPPVGPEDVERLKQQLPEYATLLQIDDVLAMPRVESPFTPNSDTRTRLKSALSASAPPTVIGTTSLRKSVEDSDMCASGPMTWDTGTGLQFNMEAKGLSKVEEHDEGKESETEEFEKVDNVPEGREVEECRTLVVRDDVSGTSEVPPVVSPAASCADFVTAEFYIDESMPSSYTESSGTRAGGMGWTGALGSGVPGGHCVKSHHVIVAELQRNLEEKNATLATLQEEFSVQQNRLRVVEGVLEALYALDREKTNKLNDDMTALRKEVTEQRDELKRYMTQAWSLLLEALSSVGKNLDKEQKEIVDNALGEIQKQHEDVLGQFQSRLQQESEQLSEAKKQVEELERQLEENDSRLSTAKEENEKELEELKAMHEEKQKKMILGHELELDIVKEEKRKMLNEKDVEIRDLKEVYRELEFRYNQLEEELTQRYQQEKEKVIKCLAEEKDEAVRKVEESGKVELEKELQRLQTEWEARVAANRKETEEVEEEWIQKLKQVQEECAAQVSSTQSRLEELTGREELLKEQLEHERRTWQEEKELVKEKLEELNDLKRRFPSTSTLEDEQMLAASGDNPKINLEGEIERLQRQHEEEMNALRSSLLAEKQVTFNEALNKVIEEKEKVVDELKSRESVLLQQQEEDRVFLQKLASENRTLLDNQTELQKYKELDNVNRMELERLDLELSNAYKRIDQLELFGTDISTGHLAMGTSVTPIDSQERIMELECTVKFKDEELEKLQNRIMELSMTSSAATMVQQDRISVLTCNIGDVVLLCYNENHENYLAFLVGPVYHFLHTDCLEVLGLKPVSGEGRSWVLAEVTDKEYCQAKKSQNRYRVPLGTKFYRVRAKLWSKDPGLSSMKDSRRSISGTSSVPSSPTASQ